MTPQFTETSERDERNDGTAADRTISAVKKRVSIGSAATFLGGVTLLGTLPNGRTSRARRIAGGLVGVGLIALGVRQLRAERTPDGAEVDGDAGSTGHDDAKVSDDAHAEAEQDLGAQRVADESQSVYESDGEPNPRGMTDRSDVEGEEAQEGDIHFVEGEQPDQHRETHLEGDDAHDTRLHPESDDESTEVDLSEAAMADEISEAAGPHPEQSYPAREGTDPEPISEDAPPRVGEGATAPDDADDEGERADGDQADDKQADGEGEISGE